MDQATNSFRPYYCLNCRKELTPTVRITYTHQPNSNMLLNFCPPCLAQSDHIAKIQNEDYVICKKMTTQLPQLANLSACQLVEIYNDLHENGFQQFLWQKADIHKNSLIKQYKELNNEIFERQDLGIKIDVTTYKEDNYTRQDKNILANRRHLKTLGYSWERREFAFQPDTIFGYLMGSLGEQQEEGEDYAQLRKIIYKYYEMEKQQIQGVSDYMVNSSFLLAKKGFNVNQDIPLHVKELKSQQSQIQDIIDEIKELCIDLTPEADPHTRIVNQAKENIKNTKQYTSKNRSSSREEPRERTKDKKRRKDSKRRRERQETRQQQKLQERVKRRDGQDTKQKDKSNSSGTANREVQKKQVKVLVESQLAQRRRKRGGSSNDWSEKKQNKSSSKEKSVGQSEYVEEPVKRKRGRPKGSCNLVKKKSVDPSHGEKIVLRMNLQGKRGRLQIKKKQKATEIQHPLVPKSAE